MLWVLELENGFREVSVGCFECYCCFFLINVCLCCDCGDIFLAEAWCLLDGARDLEGLLAHHVNFDDLGVGDEKVLGGAFNDDF